MKKIITVDLDNVLAKTAEAFLEYYEIHYGKKVEIHDVHYAYFNENKQFDAIGDIEEWRKVYRHFMGTTKFKVMDGAREGIQKLYDQGYFLHVLTGRNTDQKSLTYIWMEENFPGLFEDIHFSHASTDMETPKGKICNSLGAMLHIDDFVDFSLSIAKEGIPAFLFDKPWNQVPIDTPLITRVDGWEEVVNKIERLKN